MKHHDPETRAQLPEIRRVKEAAEERLLRIPGAGDVGISLNMVGGRRTVDFAIVVYLAPKEPLPELPPEETIPSEIDGAKTDVKESDRSHALGKSDTYLYRRVRGRGLFIYVLRRGQGSAFELITKPKRDPRFAFRRGTPTIDFAVIDRLNGHCPSSRRDHFRLRDDSYYDLPRRTGMSDRHRRPRRAAGKDFSSTCSDCRNDRIGGIRDACRSLHKVKPRPVIRPRGQRR